MINNNKDDTDKNDSSSRSKSIFKEDKNDLYAIYFDNDNGDLTPVIPNNNENDTKAITLRTSSTTPTTAILCGTITKIAHTIINSSIFYGFILVLVIVNAAIIAIVDYSIVDSNGILIQDGSTRNTIYYKSFHIFTAIYTFEMIMKILGHGVRIYFCNI